MTPSINVTSGVVSKVSYVSSAPTVAVVASGDTGYPYTDSVTGLSAGTATVTANVYMVGSTAIICHSSATVSVSAGAWWQVIDADVWAKGDLTSMLPANQYFDLAGLGSYPGLPVYEGSTNLTIGTVSTKGWLANTSAANPKVFNSNYFIASIPTDTTINTVSGTSVPGSFIDSGEATNGYLWYIYDGSQTGGIPLTITSDMSLGDRKVILFVKGADLVLQGKINLTKGQGFFMAITSGNILVDPNVASLAGYSLEGIYISDGQFRTGTVGGGNDHTLYVRGTVAAYGGIDLQRDLTGSYGKEFLL